MDKSFIRTPKRMRKVATGTNSCTNRYEKWVWSQKCVRLRPTSPRLSLPAIYICVCRQAPCFNRNNFHSTFQRLNKGWLHNEAGKGRAGQGRPGNNSSDTWELIPECIYISCKCGAHSLSKARSWGSEAGDLDLLKSCMETRAAPDYFTE